MKKSSVEMVVGVFVLIGLVCVSYLTIKLGKMEWMGENNYQLSARFDSVSGLRTGSPIELAGVEIGQVNSIRLDTKRMQALVMLNIQKGIELSDDVIASVKTAGLIGDKYINIIPGGSEEILKPGATIMETESAVDIEELISKYVFGDIEN
jgi:phospholipid/cholesterol/gamma-HCH transport system substrate-binding protein